MKLTRPIEWWQSLDAEKRAKILYEVGSVINTFLAAFLIQVAADIQAMAFVIPWDTAVLVSLGAAALRAGIKALLQLFVGWITTKYKKPTE